jgi:hypothetical protein
VALVRRQQDRSTQEGKDRHIPCMLEMAELASTPMDQPEEWVARMLASTACGRLKHA